MTDQTTPHKPSTAKDAGSKFQVALTALQLTQFQCATLQLLSTANTTKHISLANLSAEIGLTPNDEVYISRTSKAGVSNILIYEDGTTPHSFIGTEEVLSLILLSFKSWWN